MSVAELEIRDVLIYGQGKPQTIGINGHEIAYVGETQGDATGIIEGQGRLIAIPALIDPHTHFRTFGEDHKEDWTHASRAAIWGGVGTVLDMGNHPFPYAVTTCEAFARKLAAIEQPDISFRLWFMATPGGVSEFKQLRRDPYLYSYCAGIKLCMETTTGGLIVENLADQLEWCKVAADTDTLIAAHVGVESMIRTNRKNLEQPTMASHCVIRDTAVELEGGRQFLRLLEASGARGEIKHVSIPELVEAAIKAGQRGVHVSLEICPHHWVFSQEQLAREDGAFFKMNPPLRTVDQVAAMQRYLADGTINTVGTDHAPHTRAEKLRSAYDEVPSGVPGVQEMLPLLFTLVHEGKLTLEHMIDLTARTPAQLYGLYRKGRIEPGYDADIVLIDPSVESKFTAEEIQSKCGWSPYTGKHVYGKPHDVILAGDRVLYAKP